MASDTSDCGGQTQVIKSQSARAITFFLLSFACFTVFNGIIAFDRILSLYMTIPFCLRICFLVVTAAFLAQKSSSLLNILTKLVRWVVRYLQVRTSDTNCLLLAIWIGGVSDATCMHGLIDDISCLRVLSTISFIMICIVATSWGSDRSGMTEGIFVQFGKMLVVYMRAAKLWPSILCGFVVVLAIVSMLTELADVGSEASDNLNSEGLQMDDSGEQIHPIIRRSACAIISFRFFAVVIIVLRYMFTIIWAYDRTSSESWTTPLNICIVFIAAGIFAGGYTIYVKLLQWFSQCLRARPDKWWFVVFVAVTDFDCTCMTFGLSLSFGKWLINNHSKLSYSAVLCGLVLLLGVVTKLSVHVGETKVDAGHARTDATTGSTKED